MFLLFHSCLRSREGRFNIAGNKLFQYTTPTDQKLHSTWPYYLHNGNYISDVKSCGNNYPEKKNQQQKRTSL